MKNIKLFLTILIIFIVYPIFGQEKPVSIDDCIQIALQNHPGLKIIEENQKQAIANYHIATAAQKFHLSGIITPKQYEKSGTENSTNPFTVPGVDTNVSIFAGLNLSWDIYNAEKSKYVDLTLIGVDNSKMDAITTRESIILNVKVAYYNYILAQNDTNLRDKIRKDSDLKLQHAQKLFANGQRPIQDLSKAQVDQAQALFSYEKARNNEDVVRNQLMLAMGLEPIKDISFMTIEITELPVVNYQLTELYQLAFNYFPEIRKAELNKKSCRLQIEAAQAERKPDISFGVSSGLEYKYITDPGAYKSLYKFSEWSPAFSTSITAVFPIYTGGAISAKVDSAMASYNKSIYNEKEIINNVNRQISSYYQSLEELKKQIQISELVIENSTTYLTLAQKSYQNGIGSLLEVQDAERVVFEANVNKLRTKIDYLITLAKLSNLVGIDEKLLCSKNKKNNENQIIK